MSTRAILATLILTVSSTASGQFIMRNGQPADPIATQKKRWERQIAFVIDDVNRTCKLSEAQIRKLRLAGKGAVAATMDKYKTRLRAVQQQVGDPFGPPLPGIAPPPPDDANEARKDQQDAEDQKNDDKEETEEAVAAEQVGEAQVAVAAEVAFQQVAGILGGGPPINPWSQDSVLREPRWMRGLNSVLTKEQKASYDAVLADRKANNRAAAVASFIAAVDRRLLLGAEQRRKLHMLVDLSSGELLARQAAQRDGANQFAFFGMPVDNARQKPPIDHQELQSFLSEPQFEEWKQTFESRLKMVRQQFGRANGVGPGAVQFRFFQGQR